MIALSTGYAGRPHCMTLPCVIRLGESGHNAPMRHPPRARPLQGMLQRPGVNHGQPF